jgi:hypothetical protein
VVLNSDVFNVGVPDVIFGEVEGSIVIAKVVEWHQTGESEGHLAVALGG